MDSQLTKVAAFGAHQRISEPVGCVRAGESAAAAGRRKQAIASPDAEQTSSKSRLGAGSYALAGQDEEAGAGSAAEGRGCLARTAAAQDWSQRHRRTTRSARRPTPIL